MYFIARLVVEREYWSHFGERLGLLSRSFTRTNRPSIWLQAVSVGEVLSALPLIEKLRQQFPLAPIYLSTATIAGRRAAERHIDSSLTGLFYSPLDYVSCVRRVLKAIRPALLIVLETEIWPNLYMETKRAGARVAIVNGRISDRTWPRYRRWKGLFAPVLQLPDAVFVQSSVDYDRYAQLGVPKEKLNVEANLKYDCSIFHSPIFIETFGAAQIWIAGSTAGPNERGSLKRHMVDEDEIVLQAFRTLAVDFPRLLLILAPRHRARFSAVAQKLEQNGIRFVRRTHARPNRPDALQLPGVLLLDSIGELSRTYPLADVVFMGGSIAPRGGHNIIEPAAAGAPVVVGPHMHNFEAITTEFREAGAIVQIQSGPELAAAVRELLVNRNRARETGERARQLVEKRRGASERLAQSLAPLYDSANVKPVRSLPARYVLAGLAFAWREGGAMKRKRDERCADSQAPLSVPVVSIGGITVGGSGKTPFTVYLARRLRERGHTPAILTRGYGRRSPAKSLVFASGAHAPAALTGDEAQILLRASSASAGIGADRYQTAQLLLSHFPATSVLLLDDGFQHARMKRDLDIVLIDGLDPFGLDEIVPLGRLREPLTALSRADILVVTRAEEARYEKICERLREYNARAPIFRTRLLARQWRNYRTNSAMANLPGRRVAAFCGLGNPENFWRTLESLGLEVLFRSAFGDHHVYQPFELQRIARQARACGAQILVTTEKDRFNCPSQLERAIAPLELAWLEVDMELENETAFLAYVEEAIRRRAVA